jgi:hypothetical protein
VVAEGLELGDNPLAGTVAVATGEVVAAKVGIVTVVGEQVPLPADQVTGEAMHQLPNRTRATCLALATLAVVLLGACSSAGGSTSTPAPTTLAARPTSTAKLTILAPRNGQTISRQTPEVRLGPGRGQDHPPHHHPHPTRPGPYHRLVDGKLVAMNYGLNERLPSLTRSQHLVQVEFVAADHAPFDLRVLTQAAFTVKP